LSKKDALNVVRQFRFEDIDIYSKKATYWLKDNLSRIKPMNQGAILRSGAQSPNSVKPGKMYFFSYDPKFKSTMPFYDQFPLVVVLNYEKNGFLGLNLHYLRFHNRAIFLNYLIEFADSADWFEDPKAAMLLEYYLIKKSPGMRKFLRACIKSYRYNHFLSGVVQVSPSDWKIVPFLPIDRFQKASREEVWKWSASL
jgi:hypothetical protein